MKVVKSGNLNLRQIAESGQCFRWQQLDKEGNRYLIVTGRHYTVATQTAADEITLTCTPEELAAVWWPYFDLDNHAYKMLTGYAAQEDDRLIREAAAEFGGIRILRQDTWEMIISFIISQNNNIPRIKQAIALMTALYGEPLGYVPCKYYDNGEAYAVAFPAPDQLDTLDKVAGLGLGYRDKYIADMAAYIRSYPDYIRFSKTFSYELLHDNLMEHIGIGDKVADCIALYGYHCLEAYPVDTWVRKINQHFGSSHYIQHKYGQYAGIMQQYLYAYARKHNLYAAQQQKEGNNERAI